MTAARALAEGKALPAPAQSDSYAAAGVPVGGGASTSRISQLEAKRHLSAYGGTQPIDTVSNCVNVYIDAAMSADYCFEKNGERYVTGREKDSPPEAKVAPKDLVDLIEQPNPYQDWNEFFSLTITDYLLVGNFYWLKFRPTDGTDKPIALYRLSPSHVTVIPGKTELIAAYEYQIPGRDTPVRFPADQVIHGRRPNPHNAYLGLGIIAAGARMLDIELALTETQAQFFEQGAKLSGVLQSDRRVPDPVFKKISAQFRSMYSGSANAYKVAILEQGLKFQSIQPTAAESEFEALSRLSFERQCRLFRMPPELLGGVDKVGVLQEAKRQFTNDTMGPFLERMEKIITLGLTRPGWGLDFEIDYKYVMPREDQLKLVAGFATLPGITVNEVRSEAGLSPLPVDKVGPDGEPIGEMIINLPGKSTEQPGGHPTMPMPGQAGRPPLPENTLAFPTAKPTDVIRGSAGAPRPNGFGAAPHQAAATTGKAVMEIIAEASAIAGKALRARDAIQVAHSDSEDVRAQIQNQIRGEFAAPLHHLERAIFDHVMDGKALKKSERPRVVDAVANSGAWPGFEQAILTGLSKAAADGLRYTTIQQSSQNNLTMPEIDFEALGQELAGRETGAKSITGTLKTRVVTLISEGVRRGYSSSQIINGYPDENYGGIRTLMKDYTDGQLNTIANTESTMYYNEAALQLAEKSGSGRVLVSDGHYDAACENANGQIWSVTHARENPMEHPNCIRSFLPLAD